MNLLIKYILLILFLLIPSFSLYSQIHDPYFWQVYQHDQSAGIVHDIEPLSSGFAIGGDFEYLAIPTSGLTLATSGELVPSPQYPQVNGSVHCFTGYRGGIFVGGSFTSIQGNSISGVGFIDAYGSVYPSFSLPFGVNDTILALEIVDQLLWVGGNFSVVVTSSGFPQVFEDLLCIDLSTGQVLTDLNYHISPIGSASRISTIEKNDENTILAMGGAYESISFTNSSGISFLSLQNFQLLSEITPSISSSSGNVDIECITFSAEYNSFYFAGSFSQVNGLFRDNIASINPDGVLSEVGNIPLSFTKIFDIKVTPSQLWLAGESSTSSLIAVHPTTGAIQSTFPTLTGAIKVLELQLENALIAGEFQVNSIDNSFTSIVLSTGLPSSQWNDIELLGEDVHCISYSESLILIGGNFLSPLARKRTHIARFNEGSVTPAIFPKETHAPIFDLVAQGSKLYAASQGAFPLVSWDFLSQNYTVTEASFQSAEFDSAQIRALHLQEGALWIGGEFSSITYAGSSYPYQRIASFSPLTLALNTSFTTPFIPDGTVLSIEGQDSKLFLAGKFSEGIQQISSLDGSVNPSFTPEWWNGISPDSVLCLKLQNETLWVGSAAGILSSQSLKKFSSNTGDTLPSFIYPNGSVRNLYLDTYEPSLWISGNFTSINGVSRVKVAAVDTITSLVKTWNPSFISNSIYKTVASDEYVLIAGTQVSYGTTPSFGLSILSKNTCEVFHNQIINDQYILSGQTPSPLKSYGTPIVSGAITYQWLERISGDTDWNLIPLATDGSYTFLDPLNESKEFVRLIYTFDDDMLSCTDTSNTILITVLPYYYPIQYDPEGLVQGSVSFFDSNFDGKMEYLRSGIKDDLTKFTGLDTLNASTYVETDLTSYYSGIQKSHASSSFEVVDYDQDAIFDYIFINIPQPGIYNGNSGSIIHPLPNLTEASFALGDVDQDGRKELLYMGKNGTQLEMYLTEYSGTGFTTTLFTGLPALQKGAIALADIDLDGDLDVFILGENLLGVNSFQLFFNDAMSFTLEQTFIGVSRGDLSLFDVDADGDLDVFVHGRRTGTVYQSQLYKNTPLGFVPFGSGEILPLENASHTVADLDNDGDFDLLISGKNGTTLQTLRYKNEGDGHFTLEDEVVIQGVHQGSLDVADPDEDGDLDLILIGNASVAGTDGVSILYQSFQNLLGSNKRPNAPTDLQSEVSFNLSTMKGSVRIQWADAIDRESESNLLSYAVWVRNSSGEWIVYPESDLENGELYKYKNENLYPSNFAILKNLDQGTYTYAVQAVDPGRKGSRWSSIGSFKISAFKEDNILGVGGSVVLVDIDQDKDLDLFYTGLNEENVRVVGKLISTPSGFENTFLGNGLSEASLFSVDFNRDLKMDILYTGISNVGVPQVGKIIQNTLLTPQSIPQITAVSKGDITAFDADNDGDSDVFISGTSASGEAISKLYLVNGNTLSPHPEHFQGLHHAQVLTVDPNKDGYTDIFILGDSAGITKFHLYTSNTLGGYIDDVASIASIPPLDSASMAIGDINNDGFVDLVLSGYSTGNYTTLYSYYLPGMGFSNPQVLNFGVTEGAIKLIDINADGYLDLVMVGTFNGVPSGSVCINSSGNFSLSTQLSIPALQKPSIAIGDISSDYKPDIFMSGWNTEGIPELWMLTNILESNEELPSPPSSLNALVTGSEVAISWNSGNDPEGATLQYSVNVSTTLLGSNVLSGDGFVTSERKDANRPNVGYAQNLQLTLSEGEYYYKIQSIDAAGNPSPWITGGTFIVGAPCLDPAWVYTDTAKVVGCSPDTFAVYVRGALSARQDTVWRYGFRWKKVSESTYPLTQYAYFEQVVSGNSMLVFDSLFTNSFDPSEEYSIQSFLEGGCQEDFVYGNEQIFRTPAPFGTQEIGTSQVVFRGSIPDPLLDIGTPDGVYNATTTSWDTSNFIYKWQKSRDEIQWEWDADASTASYTFTVAPDSSAYYRRISIQGSCYRVSNAVFIEVLQPYVAENDSLILVDIYQQTGGSEWHRPWNLSTPAHTWQGVTAFGGSVYELDLSANNLTGVVPPSVEGFSKRTDLKFNISSNALDFRSMENYIGYFNTFIYSPQENIYEEEYITMFEYDAISLESASEGVYTRYQWYKNGEILGGKTNPQLEFHSLHPSDTGVYTCKVTNILANELTLDRRPIHLEIKQYASIADSLELVKFYISTLGPSWNITWDLHSVVDTWYGVKLEGGRVVRIELISNNLGGVLPDWSDSTDVLSRLKYMNLFDNQIGGEIPLSTKYLNGLEFINLEKNEFEGSIGDQFVGLTKLTSLYLGSNRFNVLNESLGNLTNLEVLFLENNRITEVPESCSLLSKIRKISLSRNQLTQWNLDFSMFTALDYLQLSNNQLESFTSSVSTCPNLTYLDVSTNKLRDLPYSLRFLGSIEVLKIHNNSFTFEDIEPLMVFSSREFIYSPQAFIESPLEIHVTSRSALDLQTICGGSENRYQWFFEQDSLRYANQSIYHIGNFKSSQAGSYTCYVKSALVPGLVLERHPIVVLMDCSTATPFTITTQDPLRYCEGAEISSSLEANFSLNTGTWKWFKNEEYIYNSNTKSIQVHQEGTYHAEYTSTNGCVFRSENVIISSFSYPAPVIHVEDQMLVCLDSVSNVFYQWYLDGEALAYARSARLEPPRPGQYSLVIQTEEGCIAYSEVFNYQVTATEEDDISKVLFRVFPNPSSNVLNVESLFNKQIVDIAFFDPLGRDVTAFFLLKRKEGNIHSYIITHISSSSYICRCQFEDGTQQTIPITIIR